jgi:hypothetical protein
MDFNGFKDVVKRLNKGTKDSGPDLFDDIKEIIPGEKYSFTFDGLFSEIIVFLPDGRVAEGWDLNEEDNYTEGDDNWVVHSSVAAMVDQIVESVNDNG